MDNKEDLRLIKTINEEYYVDSEGRRQGKCIEYSSLGNIWGICNYVDNKKDGEFIRYYYDIDIILFKCNFSKGLFDGEYIQYYESKRKSLEGNYVKGKKEGYWLYFEDEENAIHKIIYYKDGKKCDHPSLEVKNARKKI